jgi:hypothetical protein
MTATDGAAHSTCRGPRPCWGVQVTSSGARNGRPTPQDLIPSTSTMRCPSLRDRPPENPAVAVRHAPPVQASLWSGARKSLLIKESSGSWPGARRGPRNVEVVTARPGEYTNAATARASSLGAAPRGCSGSGASAAAPNLAQRGTPYRDAAGARSSRSCTSRSSGVLMGALLASSAGGREAGAPGRDHEGVRDRPPRVTQAVWQR